MDHILYQIFKIISSISLKNMKQWLAIQQDIVQNFKHLKQKKLYGSTKIKVNKSRNSENIPHLEITEVILVHCNNVYNDYQQDSRVLCTFVPIKPFGLLLDNSPENLILLKSFNSEFSYIEVWFTDQSSKPLEIKDKTYIALVIN